MSEVSASVSVSTFNAVCENDLLPCSTSVTNEMPSKRKASLALIDQLTPPSKRNVAGRTSNKSNDASERTQRQKLGKFYE